MHWGYGAVASVLLLGSVGAEVAHQSSSSFDAQRARLEATWHRDVQAGLPAKDLLPVTAHLAALAAQHWGPVPGRWIPNYLAAPIKDLDTETTTVMAHYTSAARTETTAALAHLNQVEGQFGASRSTSRQQELHQATTPTALAKLTSRWSAEAAQFQSQVEALAAAGGPEQDGVPADVASRVATLSGVTAQAQELGVSTSAADTALDAVKT